MKEYQNQENLIENTSEEILPEETYAKNKNIINKEINLSIFNYDKKISENFKLINEEEEILLCKEEIINEIELKREKKDEIKIAELFKGEDTDSIYYLNKKDLRKKYLKIEENINEDYERREQIIDNKNEKEIEKLYEEVQLKHPRKIIDGKIMRYPFFSWSGFFCCNRPEYISLGEAYITYFNTIKLLIIFFLIIAIINAPLIGLFISFTSVYEMTKEENY